MQPRFTMTARDAAQSYQIALTLMQAAAELELLPAKHYAKWGRPRNELSAAAVSDLMRQIEQLAAEWRVIANEA